MRFLTLLCLAQILGAQGADPWGAFRSSNPPGLAIDLRLRDSRPFRQGELIKSDLNLPTVVPSAGTPPAEQWQFTGILLDPPGSCGTVAKPCFANEGIGFGIRNGPSSRSEAQSFALNAYLPVLPPGLYRVAALARKLVLRTYGAGS